MTGLILCFDLDGTLVQPGHHIHPKDVEVLKNHRDVLFIPSTGRTLSAVKQVFQRNGLFGGQPIPFPMILQNGAAVYLEMEQLIRHETFRLDAQNELIEMLSGYTQISHLLISLDRIEVIYPSEFASQINDQLDFTVQEYEKSEFSQNLSKVMCIGLDDQSLDEIGIKAKKVGLEAAYSLSHVMEITPPGIDKGNGLDFLLKNLAVKDDILCAAGDGENDLPILRKASVSFAPSSSPEQIHKWVDRVIDEKANGILEPIIEYITRRKGK